MYKHHLCDCTFNPTANSITLVRETRRWWTYPSSKYACPCSSWLSKSTSAWAIAKSVPTDARPSVPGRALASALRVTQPHAHVGGRVLVRGLRTAAACQPLHARAPALPRLRLCLQPCTSGQVSDDASMVDLWFGFGCAGFGEVRWTLDGGCRSFVDQRPCIMYRSDAADLRRRGL